MFDGAVPDPSTSQQVPAGLDEELQSTSSKYPALSRPSFNRDLGDQGFDENLSDEDPSDDFLGSIGVSEEDSVNQGIDATIHSSITGRKCCVFVKYFSFEEFCKAAHRVVAWERGPNEKQTIAGFAFQIDPFDDSEPHSYYMKAASDEPSYFRWLFHELPDIPIITIRVAETERGLPLVGEKVELDHLKVIAPGFGHVFIAVDGQRRATNHEDKGSELLRTAISFLFGEEHAQVTGSDNFSVSVPGYQNHHVDLQADAVLTEEMRKILSEIAENTSNTTHASIFIYEKNLEMRPHRSKSPETHEGIFVAGEYGLEKRPHISNPHNFESVWTVKGPGIGASFDYHAPFTFELFDQFVWEKVFKTSRKSAIIIIPNTEAWDSGLHSQIIGKNPSAITPREWNQYFNENFKPGVSIHVMRPFVSAVTLQDKNCRLTGPLKTARDTCSRWYRYKEEHRAMEGRAPLRREGF